MSMEMPALIPLTKSFRNKQGWTTLRQASILAESPELAELVPVVAREIEILLEGSPEPAADVRAIVHLRLDTALNREQYRITIERNVEVSGGSYSAVAAATTVLLQLMSDTGELPYCHIEDEPDLPYRGLLLDVARQRHSPDMIRQMIDLCRLYRLSHLHLHLTDNESFTFPLAAYPHIPTPNRHYSRQELTELVEYAHKRGIQLVPEIDLPGHSRRLNEAEPGIFTSGFGEAHGNVICLGSPDVFEAVATILDEVCEVFRYSEYVHIGGDETNMSFYDNCPVCRKGMERFSPSNAESLLRDYVIRAAEVVKRNGKKAIVWEGFSNDAGIEIPSDITVVAWESYYNTPDQLDAAGFTLINASWKPLYATPTKHWPPEEIYAWNSRRWGNYWEKSKAYLNPIQLDESFRPLGMQFCSWENEEKHQIDLLHLRVPAMAERAWNERHQVDWPIFAQMLEQLDRKTIKLLEKGNKLPGS
jgi:hexosaminidase